MDVLDESKLPIQQARERVAVSKTLQSTSAELFAHPEVSENAEYRAIRLSFLHDRAFPGWFT